MFEYYITFRSVTGAQQGARLLYQSGINCQMIRTPKSISVHGCGYALCVRANVVSQAVYVLRRNGVAFQRTYHSGADGTLEEVVL